MFFMRVHSTASGGFKCEKQGNGFQPASACKISSITLIKQEDILKPTNILSTCVVSQKEGIELAQE